MKKIWLVAICLMAPMSGAQVYDGDAERAGFQNLTQSGKLVNLIVEPGDKQIRLQVVAKEIGALQLSDGGVEAYYGSGPDRQRIKLVRIREKDSQKDIYVFDRPNTPIQNLEINVRSAQGKEKFSIPTLK